MKSATILIIEDDPHIRRLLRISLMAQDFRVLDAETGQAGIILASNQQIDLIILDLGLPDLDGQQVMQKLRTTLQTPVIILSVRSDEKQKVLALDAGANDYVTKPFGIEELMARVRVNLRQNEGMSVKPEQIRVLDGLRIDLLSHEISLDGEIVHLTPKEFELLSALTVQPGQIVPHRQLMRLLWKDVFAEETHYLRILVSQLRKKLNDDPIKPRFIGNVQGVGYRFLR